ncbi:MAG: HEPN domain-containing protein [Planctomycetia bacterium]|jgi:HEPN domain-containing protein
MTTNELAAGYYRKCIDRLAALEVLHARAAFSDVVRESQEVVELALKGMLRWAGIDPPKIHDVGDLLLQFAERFESVNGQELKALAEASKELRKEREFSFYGDIDFIPTDEYDADDADTALGQARLAAACLGRLLAGNGPRP